MDGLTIKVWPSMSEDGYMYEIYDTEEPDEDSESVDGGLCTGSFADAVDMACEQAKALTPCQGCGEKLGERPALSRYGHGDICTACGTREAMEGDFIEKAKRCSFCGLSKIADSGEECRCD